MWTSFLIILLAGCGCSHSEFFLKRDHSLTPPYITSWIPYGSTMITPNFIRLTNEGQGLQGGIYGGKLVDFPDWEVHLTFNVHGTSSNLFGDGFAFWYLGGEPTLGRAFGFAETFKGLAIFFDTYSNHNGEHNHDHPYISAMVNNGSLTYDHDRDGTLTQLAGCTCAFRNKDKDTIAAIRYQGNTLKVSYDLDNSGSWEECFTVDGVQLPTDYRFALSAATGELTDIHDVISLKTYQLDSSLTADQLYARSQIIPTATNFEEVRERVEDEPQSSGFWSKLGRFLMWLVIISSLIGAALGIYFYTKREAQRRKRFY